MSGDPVIQGKVDLRAFRQRGREEMQMKQLNSYAATVLNDVATQETAVTTSPQVIVGKHGITAIMPKELTEGDTPVVDRDGKLRMAGFNGLIQVTMPKPGEMNPVVVEEIPLTVPGNHPVYVQSISRNGQITGVVYDEKSNTHVYRFRSAAEGAQQLMLPPEAGNPITGITSNSGAVAVATHDKDPKIFGVHTYLVTPDGMSVRLPGTKEQPMTYVNAVSPMGTLMVGGVTEPTNYGVQERRIVDNPAAWEVFGANQVKHINLPQSAYPEEGGRRDLEPKEGSVRTFDGGLATCVSRSPGQGREALVSEQNQYVGGRMTYLFTDKKTGQYEDMRHAAVYWERKPDGSYGEAQNIPIGRKSYGNERTLTPEETSVIMADGLMAGYARLQTENGMSDRAFLYKKGTDEPIEFDRVLKALNIKPDAHPEYIIGMDQKGKETYITWTTNASGMREPKTYVTKVDTEKLHDVLKRLSEKL